MKITCKKAVELISKEEENKITFFQKLKLEYHLFSCSLCKYFKKQNTIITNSFLAKAKKEITPMSEIDKLTIIKAIEEA